MSRIQLLAYAILDGTLILIDRAHRQKPYHYGKHRRHGVCVQIITDAARRLVWASAALPGPTHDLTAARAHGIIAALTSAKVLSFTDKAYQGAGKTVRTPVKRHQYRLKLSTRQKACTKPTLASAPAANEPSRPSRPGRC
ncbi:hypothetical protein GCM10010174_84680 [Kutzneria viridogrisea]|uniref:DDE Tnp4 domain-containing protein n=1 Tax=Kutzneria viridogrisea TaxID=47990 RepID=A0ABR6BBK1_9PSEU|nr:hypothetical protein [Kutzneria viridogrisea]